MVVKLPFYIFENVDLYDISMTLIIETDHPNTDEKTRISFSEYRSECVKCYYNEKKITL